MHFTSVCILLIAGNHYISDEEQKCSLPHAQLASSKCRSNIYFIDFRSWQVTWKIKAEWANIFVIYTQIRISPCTLSSCIKYLVLFTDTSFLSSPIVKIVIMRELSDFFVLLFTFSFAYGRITKLLILLYLAYLLIIFGRYLL